MESLNDKRELCILLRNGLSTLIENIRSKIFSLQNLELLEQIMEFSGHIHSLMYKVIEQYTKTKLSDYKKGASYFPRIIQARQMSVHAILCSMESMLSDLKKSRYFTSCNKVFVVKQFYADAETIENISGRLCDVTSSLPCCFAGSTPKNAAQTMDTSLLNVNTPVHNCQLCL